MKNLYILFLIMFAIGTDTFIVSPLLPTLKDVLNIRPEHIGWLVGAYALGYGICAIFIGPFSDGWDRKKLLLLGLITFATSTLLCGWAFNEWSILFLRLLAGVSAAMVAPQIWALIPSLVASKDIVKGIGITAAGLSISQILGVPLGSYLAVKDWSVPFIIIGIFSYVLFILSLFMFPSPKTSQNQSAQLFIRYKHLVTSPQSIPNFSAYLLFQIGNFASFTTIGMVLHDYYHLSLFGIGTIMMILGSGNLIGSLAGPTLTKMFGQRNVFFYGMVILVLLYLILAMLPLIPFFITSFVLVFTIGGMLFPLMMSSLQSINASLRGTISSLASATMYAGAFIGSTVAGGLYHKIHGFQSVGLFTVFFFLLSILFYTRSKLFTNNAANRV